MDDIAQLKRRLERLEALHTVGQVIHSTLDLREALSLILREAVRLMRANSGTVSLVNPTTGFLEVEAIEGFPASARGLRLKVGEGITGWVAKTGQAARVSDVATDRRYVRLRPGVGAEMAVPLRVGDAVRGIINVDADRVDAFTAEDLELLQDLAAMAAPAIANTWLYEQARQKARLLESLVRVGQIINSTLSLDEALQAIVRETRALLGAKMCSLMMVDDSREWLDLRAHYGAGKEYVAKPRISLADSFIGIVIRRRKPMQLENVQKSGRYQNASLARKEGLVSLLSVPLLFSGKAIGTLNLYTGEPHTFSDEEVRTLSAYAELSALALEKARLYDRIVQVEETLRQSERLSALGLLAAEVAHEIRNPLTVIKMLHHSLALEFPATDPRATDVRIMGEKMDHLNRIVDRVLDFARGSEPQRTQVDVNQLVDDLGLLTRHTLRVHNVELVRRLDPRLPMISADATQLEQAFLNLTLNAVEAMPKGGRLTIRTRTLPIARPGQRPTHVMVRFRDTGEGMSEEQRKRAFSSLLQTTKPKGTGLGLAIVARVVDQHQGLVKVWSQLAKGTTISVVLPVGA
jgi:signal transduction histidine kinase